MRALAGALRIRRGACAGHPAGAGLRRRPGRAVPSAAATEVPGATALVKALSPRARLAIASNDPAALVRLGVDQISLYRSYFDTIVSGEEGRLLHTRADVYLHAARKSACRPGS